MINVLFLFQDVAICGAGQTIPCKRHVRPLLQDTFVTASAYASPKYLGFPNFDGLVCLSEINSEATLSHAIPLIEYLDGFNHWDAS